MKTFKILFIASLIVAIFIWKGFGKHVTSPKASTEELISSTQALSDFKDYIKKQITKHDLKLSPEQIDGLMTKGRKLIYENLCEGQISNIDSRKIQKDLKLYLKTNYPEKFQPKRSNNEVNYNIARRRIRAITKDFAKDSLKAKNKQEINKQWNKVKGMVYKKLDKAAYFNDYNELVVDESAIPEIISKTFAKLTSDNNNNPNNQKHKRKTVVASTKITSPIAEKLVRKMIRNKGISAKDNETLLLKIMEKINKTLDKKGKVEKDLALEIAKKEIDEFQELKKSIQINAKKKYIDRFLDAMGKTPPTEVN